MGVRPSDMEIQRRIAALLKTPRAGRAVAGHLKDQTDDWAQRAAVTDLRARRLEAFREKDAGGDVVTEAPLGRVH